MVELALCEAPAADEGADLSGGGLDRDHGGLERVRRLAPRALGLSQPLPHCRFRCVLQAPIEAGDQLHAAQRFAAALRDFAAHELHEPRSGRGRPLRRSRRVGHRHARLGRARRAVLHHRLEDAVAPVPKNGRRFDEDAVGRTDRRGKQRDLVEPERLEVLAEEVACPGADAEHRAASLLTEVDGVEVGLQDLRLRVARLEHEGDADLARLAPPAALAGQEQPARELLRDRAGAADHGVLAGVGDGGAGDREQVHAVMTHEPAVLGGDDRGGDSRRDALEGHPDLDAPRLALERRDLSSVDVQVDDRRRRRPGQRQSPPSPGERDQAKDRSHQQQEPEEAAWSLHEKLSAPAA